MEKFLIISLVISILAISQVSALHCWRCSSDAANSDYCADPFNPSRITETQRRWSYVECALPPADPLHPIPRDARPVCKKQIHQYNDKIVFARSCTWESQSLPADNCKYASTPRNMKIMYCETCTTDGCNAEKNLNNPTVKTPTAETSGAVSGYSINGFTALVTVLLATFVRGV